ncbi:hypothetical protein BDP27DRAFT_1375121 [Rhodocollybia butyracea]|uniref:DUF6589 domain-containing protein n=1 Tax=Rhodocollybia butyracea TaxID=206335 RepID=A0A9P5P1C9_9AGAR|nr:hypothetical protein BDP27DRAFT_1375121 [Rhodocollybia butyracea]
MVESLRIALGPNIAPEKSRRLSLTSEHGSSLCLVQEHLNFWIKTIYKAHGSNATWEWLFTISPYVGVLRELVKSINDSIGTSSQGTRHAPPDLSKDIETLMNSLEEHNVYTLTKGRVLDAGEEPSVDVVSKGLEQLLHGTPLVEYNQAFKQLQRRRRIQPIVGESEYYDKLRHATLSIDTEVLLDADLEFIPQFSVDEDEPCCSF